MKKRKLVFILLILILAFFFFGNKIDDDSVKNNYYQAINQDILLDNTLEDGKYSWSYFTEAQDRVDQNTNKIVKSIISGETKELDTDQIKVIQSVYDKALNMEERDRVGLDIIELYLDRVLNVSSVVELLDIIIVIENDLGIDLLTNIEVMADYQDNNKNIIYFVPVTFAFGANSDYIVNADYMAYKAYLRRACIQLWKAYGYSTMESRQIVERVFSFYEGVANNSKLSFELEDIASYYQVITEDELVKTFTNINLEYLSRRGLDNRDIYSMVDQDQYQYLNASLTNENLNMWKEVIITKVLSSYASYGSSDYVQIVDNLNMALLGVVEQKSNEEMAIDIIKNLFADEIDTVYEKQFLNREQENEIEAMILEIKKVYNNRLSSNNWLSKTAIDKALIKLEAMDIIIGLDDEGFGYEIASNLERSDASFIQDIIMMQQIAWNRELELLDSDEKLNLVSQSVVNAYYQPLDNSIVIPVAFFELVSNSKSYYEKLGTLGMILAHEVTHGFDGNGSKFDEDGNLSNWWSEEDKKAFDFLQKEVSSYYSKYEVLNGKYINGEKTVNENIADLGAIECISEIALNKGASEEELRVMFSSFAKIWASHETKEYMELLLLQDVHAPNQFRVNAVLSSNDLFYQVYDIYPWNKMWIPKDKRISVW